MICGDRMTEQKKEVFTKMLYNKKVVLIWDFMEIEKVSKKVAPPQKIQTVDH